MDHMTIETAILHTNLPSYTFDNLECDYQFTRPKEIGGLDVSSISFEKKVLLGKWWLCFQEEKNTLWCRSIIRKHGMQKNYWNVVITVRTTFKSPWWSISWVYWNFCQLVKVHVRGGNIVRFWECLGRRWFSSTLVSSLYCISLWHHKPIASFVSPDFSSCSPLPLMYIQTRCATTAGNCYSLTNECNM